MEVGKDENRRARRRSGSDGLRLLGGDLHHGRPQLGFLTNVTIHPSRTLIDRGRRRGCVSDVPLVPEERRHQEAPPPRPCRPQRWRRGQEGEVGRGRQEAHPPTLRGRARGPPAGRRAGGQGRDVRRRAVRQLDGVLTVEIAATTVAGRRDAEAVPVAGTGRRRGAEAAPHVRRRRRRGGGGAAGVRSWPVLQPIPLEQGR